MRIILASGSPRRHFLLKMINLAHEVIPSSVIETIPENEIPEQVAQSLAMQKANDVAAQHSDALVIGADTIVVLHGQILGKPESVAHAEEMLRMLSAETHTVITGVVLVPPAGSGSEPVAFHEATKVTFSELTPDEISAYVAGGSPMDKAGSYGIQDDLGCLFVKHIEGDYYNVVGLPLQHLYRQLRKMNPQLTQHLFTNSDS
ncbi:MAG: Maf family protein [Balneolales bacterium]|nr:Maf family protein [Balneolales bacterium]